MSHRDFVDRWLTLGTESKLGLGSGIAPPQWDPNQPFRPIMGEKGIGRLAIAAIGPQTLVLTRAKARVGADRLVAAFIHWGVFSLPGVELSEIQIPLRLLPGGTLPSNAEVASMVAEVRRNIESVAARLPSSEIAPVVADLKDFDIAPDELYLRLPQGPTLLGEGYGTHFIILPSEETLCEDIDGSASDDTAPPLIKVLVGFTNTMTPGQAPPAIKARFRDHALDGTVKERIAGTAFFTPHEFNQADHHVFGEFDKFGQFRGKVQVYGTKPADYLLPWREARGKPLLCGPLKINSAYLQGEARATKLLPEDHARRVDRFFGGSQGAALEALAALREEGADVPASREWPEWTRDETRAAARELRKRHGRYAPRNPDCRNTLASAATRPPAAPDRRFRPFLGRSPKIRSA